MRLNAAKASGALRLSVMLRLLRCRFWKSDPSRGPPSGSPPPGSGGNSILMTLAPQSASWRTQVGPARTRVRSRTVKRWSAPEALGKGLAFGSLRIVSFCCISCCIPLPGGRREPDIASSLACCARRRGFEQAGLYPLWSVQVGRCNIARLDALMATPPLILPSLTKLSRTLVALSIAGTSTLAIAQERPRRPPAQQSEQHASDP